MNYDKLINETVNYLLMELGQVAGMLLGAAVDKGAEAIGTVTTGVKDETSETSTETGKMGTS